MIQKYSVFRIFPGSPGNCPNGVNNYDPRVRPWYVAASSGPKDVILVLDVSGSMRDYGRLVSLDVDLLEMKQNST